MRRRRTIILLSHLLQQGNEGFVELRGNCGLLGWIGVQQMTSRECLVRRQCEICHNCGSRVRLQLWKQLEHKLQERKRDMSSDTQSNFIYTFCRFLTFSSEIEERQHDIQALKTQLKLTGSLHDATRSTISFRSPSRFLSKNLST
jgi:hypothetical protein